VHDTDSLNRDDISRLDVPGQFTLLPLLSWKHTSHLLSDCTLLCLSPMSLLCQDLWLQNICKPIPWQAGLLFCLII